MNELHVRLNILRLTLKNQYDNLRIEFNKSEFDLENYKRGLASVEEQLVFYKKNEVMFCDQIVVLKRDASFKDSEINALKIQRENLKKEKKSIKIKVDGFGNASKSLYILMGSQVSINNKKGIGFDSYNAVAPPPTSLFAPPTIDLSNSGLKEFQQPEFPGYDVKVNKSVSETSFNETKKTSDAPIIKDWVFDCDEDESELRDIENVQTKPKQANEPRKISEIPRNNSTNWNKPMSKGNNVKKGTGQREVRPVWNNAMRTNHQNFSNSRRNFVPTVVLTKSGPLPISTAVLLGKALQEQQYLLVLPVNTAKVNSVNTAKVNSVNTAKGKSVTRAIGKPGFNVELFDSGCSRHMTGNKSYLTNYQDRDGGFVAFACSSKGGKITRKGKIKTEHLDFEDVYFVKELKFNLFSVSQMCDRKNSVFFTKTECLILSPDFKLPDDNQVMLKIPRKDNMYSFDLKNSVPSKGLTCLFAKATNNESKMWHRRLGHINFKTMNKLVKGNLVRGLPLNLFEKDYPCVACQKGKQHKASCKTKLVNSINTPLQILHMDLFRPTFVKRLMVKIIRCDNGTEFKNYEMNQFYGIKGIKREFSNARTPQQNGVAERKNRTLIEGARTMLANSLLHIPFWAEAVNTACYVHNRVLVTKPHNKTPYELLIGRTPIISFMRPFGCPVSILNTLDHLG
ncbi:putative ribonuclease H-like domain-containing protein, partial [Tanacetum coccineum]